jgi:hypothetical protein
VTFRVWRREPLVEVIEYIQAQRGPVSIRVLDPDRGCGKYAGELVDDHVHRPFRVWVDLADRLDMRLRTPRVVGDYVELVFEPLEQASTPWDARMTKLEDPCFVIDFLEALDRVQLTAPRVLSLGVKRGDEIALIRRRYPEAAITGVDRDASARASARERWPGVTFIEADLAQPLAVGRFDLVVAIATLQSSDLDDRDLLRRIVQDHLEPRGAVIFAVPNCRYQDGEQRFGARMKNFSQPELGLLVKDVAFYRKYLQQHHRQVWVTGKSYILVTGGIHDS